MQKKCYDRCEKLSVFVWRMILITTVKCDRLYRHFKELINLMKHQFLISKPSHKYHVSMCDFYFCKLNWMKFNAFSFIYTHQICEILHPTIQGCSINWCWKQLAIAARTMQHPSTCVWIQACKYAKRIAVTGSFVLRP